MTSRLPLTLAERLRRKHDLLLASALARDQAVVAIDQISHRADRLVGGYRQLRAWMSVPKVGTVASVAASVAALMALRHVRSFRLLRWGMLSWRAWKLVAGFLPGLLPRWRVPR